MTKYIAMDGKAKPLTITVDGVRQPSDFPLRWKDHIDLPFAGVYVADKPQYDVEIWVDDNCLHRVPPEDAQTRLIYAAMEGKVGERSRSKPVPGGHREQLTAEIAAHPGKQVHLRWEGVGRTLNVHERNAKDLEELLAHVENSPELGIEMFQNTAPPIVRKQIQAEVDQRLHNYVASASTLVDHTRRMLNTYEGTQFFEFYQAKREPISNSPVAKFVKDLRNFVLHRELPFLGHTVTLGGAGEGSLGDVHTEMQLSCALLLTWDGWSAPAKNFISTSGDTINLRIVIADHIAMIRELYKWMHHQYQGLHRFEIAMLNELVQEYNWALSGGHEGRGAALWFSDI